mgnify:CR=1 FL=1
MSKFNIYKVDNKTSTTTNATPETIIASQIGEAIIGEYNPDFSYRAVKFGTSADTFEAMQNNNQAIGTLELTSKSAGEWMDTLSEIHYSVIDVFEAVIDARETFNLKLKKIFDISSGEKNFHSLGTIASNIECIPSPDALKPLHEIFRSCLQERYKFKFNK